MEEYKIENGILLTYFGDSKKIIIPKGIIKIAKGAFQNNKGIVHIVLNDELEEVGCWAFAGCTNLKTVTFPKKKMLIRDKCFYKCISLENITLPLITSIAPGCFQYCCSLKTVKIPNTVKRICMSAFKKCDKLQSIHIPASVKNVSSFAFSYCTSLKYIYLEGKECPLKTNSLLHCNVEILWDNAGLFVDEAKRGFIINEDGKLLRYVGTEMNIVIPSCITSIDDYAFRFNPSIKTVLIGGNVLSLGHHVFAYCNRLERVFFENGVKIVDTWLCGGCPALKEVIFSNTIEYIGNNAISGNRQICEIVFPDSMTNTSQVMNCNMLERIRFSKNTKELSFNSVLYCKNLKTIEVAKDTIISRDAVRGCGEFEIRTFN